MFNFAYLSADILLIFLNVTLLMRMHFENIAWPIIAIAIPATGYLALADFTLYFHWFHADTTYLFTERILVYKTAIATGLALSLIRVPIVRLRVRTTPTTEEEKLGGKT